MSMLYIGLYIKIIYLVPETTTFQWMFKAKESFFIVMIWFSHPPEILNLKNLVVSEYQVGIYK